MAKEKLKSFESPSELLAHLLAEMSPGRYRMTSYPNAKTSARVAIIHISFDVEVVMFIELNSLTAVKAFLISWSELKKVGERCVTHYDYGDIELS